jgi:hypothetical protein
MLQHRKQSGIKVRSEGVRPFRLLTRIQRVVLTGIRGNDRLPPATIPNPLAALRQLAGNKGMIVAAPRTSIVTADEWMMLGALAVAQRQEPILICAPDLLQIIAQCASVLTQANLRLPLPDLARTALERNGWLRLCPKPCDPERAPRTQIRQQSTLPREGSLRRRAVDAARGRAVITARELRALAISRQHLSHLCTLGLFERIAPGQYRLVTGPA